MEGMCKSSKYEQYKYASRLRPCTGPQVHADTLLDRAWCLFPYTLVFTMVFNALLKGAFLATLQQVVCAVSIADIQGASWVSTLSGQTVSNLTATVTAKVRRSYSNFHTGTVGQ